ncbi:MAG: hypothetical protein MUF43_13155, partial [Flavobacterium sp.]|nr:hypothetical protein [Flavobacterium sp.]
SSYRFDTTCLAMKSANSRPKNEQIIIKFSFLKISLSLFLGSCRHDCAEKAFCKPAGTALSATPDCYRGAARQRPLAAGFSLLLLLRKTLPKACL